MIKISGLTKAEVKKLRAYAAQLHRQCENACNGVGYIPYRGQFYTGTIDDWAKKEYGMDIQSAYPIDNNEETFFDIEIEKLEKKIESITDRIPGGRVEFQHDPRGWEVRLYVNNVEASDLIHLSSIRTRRLYHE